uniref:S-crystallin n=1 Tax=Doryteuthis opalescens TaxID=1051066 RepID=Q25368_DOROP|nr:S-crystallin [Doryteuthis opalescens]
MPNYTLYYFNGRGRAEICRMLMSAASVPYTDKRFEFNEWDKYRNEMPSFCVPVLDIDGQNKMPETMAIARYLAREHGFYGKNNMDMFRIDYICDCFYEIMHDYMRYFHAKNGRFWGNDSDMKSSDLNPYMQTRYMETCRRILPFMERSLEMRNSGSQFFMGDQMTLCDMMCYCCLENPMMENQSMFNSYPKLMALWKRVAAHPKITGYLKKRCSTNW